MSQEDYDQGYEDGRKSNAGVIQEWKQAFDQQRASYLREREEAIRLRAIIHKPVAGAGEVPF